MRTPTRPWLLLKEKQGRLKRLSGRHPVVILKACFDRFGRTEDKRIGDQTFREAMAAQLGSAMVPFRVNPFVGWGALASIRETPQEMVAAESHRVFYPVHQEAPFQILVRIR